MSRLITVLFGSSKHYCNRVTMGCAMFSFEPCTNPNDAWPIIEWIFNQDVTFAMNGGGIMTGNLGSKYGGIKLDIAAKPLRAAMEVYILMSVNK